MTINSIDQAPSNNARISRRTIIKGTAWSIPVIATAIAAPAAAGSTPCETSVVTEEVTSASYHSGTKTVTIPANATNVRYSVVGGQGGNTRVGEGGVGAVVSGTLNLGGVVTVLTLRSGGGGIGEGSSNRSRTQGWGLGGAPSRYDNPVSTPWSSGAGGGAASALLLGGSTGTPIIVAGAGGGAGNASTQGSTNAGRGGDAGPSPEDGGDGTRGVSNRGGGGGAATSTTVGAAGGTTGSVSSTFDGRPGIGSEGGTADTAGWDHDGNPNTTDEFNRRNGSGGGGGGYFGGGSGGSIWIQGTVAETGGAGGGGGAGSSYAAATVGNVVVTSSVTAKDARRTAPNIETTNYPHTPSVMGGPGSVTVTYDLECPA